MSRFGGLAIAASAAFRMELMSPLTGQPLRDKEGKAAYIEVFSTRSPAAEQWRREADEMANRARRRKDKGESYDEKQARGVEMLTALTGGWYLVDLQGLPIDAPFSKEAARELYSAPETSWIGEQVILAATEDANFIKPSSKG